MTNDDNQPFFLFIGSGDREAPTSKLKTAGVFYRKKMLESRPENWDSITDLLHDPRLVGAIVKLTAASCTNLASPQYSERVPRLLSALSQVRNIVFMHESLLDKDYVDDLGNASYMLDRWGPISGGSADDELAELLTIHEMLHGNLKEADRALIMGLIEEYDLNIVPYARNYELSSLATNFVEENDKKLLFRIYIPSGRIWAAEADQLLSLFREWLSQVKGQRIRQGGYKTSQGEVHEFYGDGELDSDGLGRELQEFSEFLELCVEDPDAARGVLDRKHLASAMSRGLIEQYAKAARRLKIDIRHERESRLLSLRQQLESQLLDSSYEIPPGTIGSYVDQLIPAQGSILTSLSRTGMRAGLAVPSVVINQQFINTVQGAVVSNLNGSLNLGPEPAQLLEMIERLAGNDRAILESSVHELEDADARPVDRLAARQRLKGFVYKVAGKIGDAAVPLLQAYLESKIVN